MEWISVKERLPEDGEKVLVLTHQVEKGLIGSRYLEGATACKRGFVSVRDGFLVTHWMPMPELPPD